MYAQGQQARVTDALAGGLRIDRRNRRAVVDPDPTRRVRVSFQLSPLYEFAAGDGELRQLGVEDVDLARRTLHIRAGKTGPRDVPLSKGAMPTFRRLMKDRLPVAFLLVREDGLPWQHSDQYELMRAAVKGAKLPAGTVFYTLRYSFIASAITAGLNIAAVAKICGTSIRIIETNYSKLLHADVREKLGTVALA